VFPNPPAPAPRPRSSGEGHGIERARVRTFFSKQTRHRLTRISTRKSLRITRPIPSPLSTLGALIASSSPTYSISYGSSGARDKSSSSSTNNDNGDLYTKAFLHPAGVLFTKNNNVGDDEDDDQTFPPVISPTGGEVQEAGDVMIVLFGD